MQKTTFYNDGTLSLNELKERNNIDLTIFNNLIEYINISLKSLGIKTEGKKIHYQRYQNKTSMLAIKLNDEDDNDKDNYLIFGAEKFEYDNCNIYFHADAKVSQLSMKVASKMQGITDFFNSFEKQLKENNNQDLELNLCMTIENNKTLKIEEQSIIKKLKRIFKKK